MAHIGDQAGENERAGHAQQPDPATARLLRTTRRRANIALALATVIAVVIAAAGLGAGVLWVHRVQHGCGACPAESNLGNAVIEAAAVYTQDGGEFGLNAARLSRELAAGDTSITYQLAGSVASDNVVSVEAFDCKTGPGLTVSDQATDCQGALLWGRESDPKVCYYVIVLKAPPTAPITIDSDRLTAAGVQYAADHSATNPPTCTNSSPELYTWQSDGFPYPL